MDNIKEVQKPDSWGLTMTKIALVISGLITIYNFIYNSPGLTLASIVMFVSIFIAYKTLDRIYVKKQDKYRQYINSKENTNG